jgi:hypothetical protein
MRREEQFVKMAAEACLGARMFSFAVRVVQINRYENVQAMAKWREQTTRANCCVRARAKLFSEFIRVPSAGGMDIKINVRKSIERKERQKR